MSETPFKDISQVSANYGKKDNARILENVRGIAHSTRSDASKSSSAIQIPSTSSTPKSVKKAKPGPKSKKKSSEDPPFEARVSISPEDIGPCTRNRTTWNAPKRSSDEGSGRDKSADSSKDSSNLLESTAGSLTSSQKKILDQSTLTASPNVSVRTDDSTLPIDTPKQKGKNFNTPTGEGSTNLLKSKSTLIPKSSINSSNVASIQSSLQNAFKLLQAETQKSHVDSSKKVSAKSTDSVVVLEERNDDDVVVINQFKTLNDNQRNRADFSSESSFDELPPRDRKLDMDTSVPLERLDDKIPGLQANVDVLMSEDNGATRYRRPSYSLVEHVPDLSGYNELEQRKIIDLANKLRTTLMDNGVTQQAVGNLTRKIVDVVVNAYDCVPVIERMDEQFEAVNSTIDIIKKDVTAVKNDVTDMPIGIVMLQNIQKALGISIEKGQQTSTITTIDKAEENGRKLDELYRIINDNTAKINRFGDFDMEQLKQTLDGWFKKIEEKEKEMGRGEPSKPPRQPMEEENLDIQPQVRVADGPPDPEQIRRYPRESLEARYTEMDLRGEVWSTIPKGKVETLHHRVPTYIDETAMNGMIEREQAYQASQRARRDGNPRGGRGGFGRGFGASKRRRDGSCRERSPSPGPSFGRLASEIVIPENSNYNQPQEASSSVIVHAERDSNFRSTFQQVMDLFEHPAATNNDLKAAQEAKNRLEERLNAEVNPMERWIQDIERNNTLVKASNRAQILKAQELEANGNDDQIWIDYSDQEQGTRSMITLRDFKNKVRTRLLESKYPYTVNSKILKGVRRSR